MKALKTETTFSKSFIKNTEIEVRYAVRELQTMYKSGNKSLDKHKTIKS